MRKNRGFTLVELMVVISIITILIGLLMPALNRARQRALHLECLNNLRVMGTAVFEYALDNDEDMPADFAALTADDYIAPEAQNCPFSGDAYTLNFGTHDHISEYISTDVMAGCPSAHVLKGGNRTNQLYGDGHVGSEEEEAPAPDPDPVP